MVKFSSTTVVVPSGSVMDIPIIIGIPKDANVPPKWVFYVRVKDVSQQTMVKTNYVVRWVIDMQ
jgi:hypothetical protein